MLSSNSNDTRNFVVHWIRHQIHLQLTHHGPMGRTQEAHLKVTTHYMMAPSSWSGKPTTFPMQVTSGHSNRGDKSSKEYKRITPSNRFRNMGGERVLGRATKSSHCLTRKITTRACKTRKGSLIEAQMIPSAIFLLACEILE